MPIRFLGSDFQINTLSMGTGIAGNQIFPEATRLTDGRFAVVYQSEFFGDPNDTDVVEAIFNSDGSPSLASSFVYAPGGLQTQPVGAALPGGGFGVVFTNADHADRSADANPNNITYERVGSTGVPAAPLAIADYNGGAGHDNIINPAIATLSTGRQVVVFESVFTQFVDDDINLNVVLDDGLSTQFTAAIPLLVAGTTSWEAHPAVAAIGNSAMVVYEDGFGTTTSSANITARIFDAGTSILGPRITIADHGPELERPRVLALDDHRYLVAYNDHNLSQFSGRIYDTNSAQLSAEFQITGVAIAVAAAKPFELAATADGGFIVTWAQFFNGSHFKILARRFNSDGGAMGQPLIVKEANGEELYPTVAVSGANAFFAWQDGSLEPGDASPYGIRGQVMTLTTPPDFNDNGISDILWRNDAGQLALWSMGNGGAISSSGYLTSGGSVVSPGANWSVAAISDFTGDGRADVLWRDSGGQTALWIMNGNAIVGSGSLTSGGSAVNPDTSWSVAGAGDFNGDGKSDILWRNTTGQLALWQMNGTTIAASSFVNNGSTPVNPDPSWSVAGIGDFDGDGESDVLWRSAAGEVAVWELNGSTLVASGDVTVGGLAPRPGPTWSVAGVGDFNADGSADILWRDSASNALVVWLMNGTNIIASGAVTVGGSAVSPDASWHVVEIGDFNGDARADMLWRNNDGTVAEWQLKGTSIISSFTPNVGGVNVSPDPTWHTQAKPNDFA